jgi:hypothetical protein
MHLHLRYAIFTALLVGAIGCAADNRPKYVEPASPKDDLATLKGAWGTYIHEVDGKRVDTNIQLANWGSNSVNVMPGPHKLMVIVHTSNSLAYHEDGGRFTFRCDKGHIYEFSRRNLFSVALKVTDKNTGQSMDIP